MTYLLAGYLLTWTAVSVYAWRLERRIRQVGADGEPGPAGPPPGGADTPPGRG